MGTAIYRRAAQTAFMLFVLLMPVFDILRYDVAAKDLYLFGSVWTLGIDSRLFLDPSGNGPAHVAFTVFVRALLPWIIVLSVFPLLGFLLGRFFCGWLCPEGALFEVADFLSIKMLGRRDIYNKGAESAETSVGGRLFYSMLAVLLLVMVPPLVGIALTGYFIAPKTIWHQLSTGTLSTGLKGGITGVWIYMFVTSVFVRHVFCKYVCAAGLMQMLFGWVSPVSLRIRFDRDDISRCTDCKSCEKVCFMDVKPRAQKRDINCVNCGKCIDACDRELEGRGLFSYNFGKRRIFS